MGCFCLRSVVSVLLDCAQSFYGTKILRIWVLTCILEPTNGSFWGKWGGKKGNEIKSLWQSVPLIGYEKFYCYWWSNTIVTFLRNLLKRDNVRESVFVWEGTAIWIMSLRCLPLFIFRGLFQRCTPTGKCLVCRPSKCYDLCSWGLSAVVFICILSRVISLALPGGYVFTISRISMFPQCSVLSSAVG